jgi:hypothetical protein
VLRYYEERRAGGELRSLEIPEYVSISRTALDDHLGCRDDKRWRGPPLGLGGSHEEESGREYVCVWWSNRPRDEFSCPRVEKATTTKSFPKPGGKATHEARIAVRAYAARARLDAHYAEASLRSYLAAETERAVVASFTERELIGLAARQHLLEQVSG